MVGEAIDSITGRRTASRSSLPTSLSVVAAPITARPPSTSMPRRPARRSETSAL